MRVLHFTDALFGGVHTAIRQYIANTPDIEHGLVASTRGRPADWPEALQISYLQLRDSLGNDLIKDFKAAIIAFKPDLIHAHSSRAGLIARGLQSSTRVVYSPHGFPFIRTSIRGSSARGYARLERSLRGRTAALGAVGEHERRLAQSLGYESALVIPHYAETTDAQWRTPARRETSRPLKVGIAARITEAKDPDSIVEIASSTREWIDWHWAGDGDQASARKLNACGVQLRGWLSVDEMHTFYEDMDAVFLPSRWEATLPFAALEPISVGVPVICRGIPAITAEGLVPTVASTLEAVELLRRMQDPLFRESIANSQRQLLDTRSATTQATALRRLYSQALASYR